MKNNNKSYPLALGGIIGSISLVLMFFTGIMPLLSYTLPAVAGALLIILVTQVSKKYAWITYASVAFLSIFVSPDKEAALLYIMFFGFYPILKSEFERIKSRVLEWIAKISVFNVLIVVFYFLFMAFFGRNVIKDEINEFGRNIIIIFWGISNIAFVLYDIALTNIISMYINLPPNNILKRIGKF